jgi:anti-sigma B factor antagonist
MDITEKQTDSGAILVALDGMLVLGRESQRLEWAVEKLIKEGKTKIIVDLSKVPYVDSAGIGILVGSLGHCKQGGGQMRVVGVDDRVMQILKITNVDKVLPLDANLEEAERNLGAA